MAHAAHSNASTSAPRPNVAAARGCHECREWGTIVTPEGGHKLCPACQPNDSSSRASPLKAPASPPRFRRVR